MTSEITENETPSPGLFHFEQRAHDAKTRKLIAVYVLTIFAVLLGALVSGLLLGILDSDGFLKAMAGISGVQTIAAAITAFYFAKEK